MTPERWQIISEIYHSAIELDDEPRQVYLDNACGPDADLRLEVESLLKAESDAGDFIAEPIVGNNPPDLDLTVANAAPGMMIGHYRVVSSLGSGGMGEVYLATDTRLGRKVALKTLPPGIANDESYLRRFRNEAFAAANINHPNVSTVYSVEENGDRPFITMEYIEGETLDRCVPADGLAIEKFVDWFANISDALACAHRKGVIHRDIKPGNIMIVDGSIPKILDFGLALIDPQSFERDDSAIHITKPGQIIGTPSYMSPEQAEGKEIDHRSDVFSLGVLMYEAITGRRPFNGASHAEIVSNLLKSVPEPITSVRQDVPDPLVRLIERCLAKPRELRFQTMREVSDALSVMEAYSSTGRSLESFQRRLFRESRPASGKWIPAAALVVAISALGLWYIFSADRHASTPNFADLTFRKLSQSNNVVFAHITADGQSVVYNTIEENEMRAMYVRRIDDRNALRILAPEPIQFWGGLTTSRDGGQIYYITAERAALHGTLYRISSLGGQPRKLAETVNDLGSLSPDGKRVLYIRYVGSEAHLLSANTEDGTDEQTIATAGTNALFRDPQFSSDGTRIYVIRFDVSDGSEFWSVVEIPAAGGNQKTIIPKQRPKISELVTLREADALLMNATDPISNLPQIYHLSLSTGRQTRITNDLNLYFGVSTDDAGETIVSAQRQYQNNIWIGDPSDPGSLKSVSPEPNIYLNAELAQNGSIIFDAIENNRPHIYKMDSNGDNLQQLTPNNSSDHHPRISPDGRHVVFESDRTGEGRVWRMNSDGSEPVLLTAGEGSSGSPDISPDGKTVYFFSSRDGQRSLYQVPINGGETTKAPFDSVDYLALSPDGFRVAYTVADANQKRPRITIRRTDDPRSAKTFPFSPIHILKWANDGSSVYYREREAGENPYATVWRLDPVTGVTTEFLSVKPDHIYDLSFSPDGKTAVVIKGTITTDAVSMTKVRAEMMVNPQ